MKRRDLGSSAGGGVQKVNANLENGRSLFMGFGTAFFVGGKKKKQLNIPPAFAFVSAVGLNMYELKLISRRSAVDDKEGAEERPQCLSSTQSAAR